MSENAMPIRALVVRLPNWVGDAVMATPALRSLRMGFPEARICAVGKKSILDFLDGLRFIDDRIEISGHGLGQILRQARALRAGASNPGSFDRRRFDLGILLPNSFSSALAFFLGGVRRRIGYALNGRSWLLNRRIRPVMAGLKREPSPMTGYYLDLCRFAGGADTGEAMELATDPVQDREAERFFQSHNLDKAPLVIGLNPGASFGPSKLWTPEGFAGVADRFHERHGAMSVLLGGPGEERLADAVLEKARSSIVDTSRNIVPLDRLKSVIKRLDALVTTDTGPRHFAAALSVPVVVIMGPTDPRYTDSNLTRTRVVRHDVECGPCHKKICDLDHRCMRDIRHDEVVDHLETLLGLSSGTLPANRGGHP